MARTPDFKSNKSFSDLLREATKPRPFPETGWYRVGLSEAYQIPFENGWDNVSATNVPASWYLSEDGEVRLRGNVFTDGEDFETTIFTLPEEVRPEYTETYVVPLEDDGSIHLENIHFRAFQGVPGTDDDPSS